MKKRVLITVAGLVLVLAAGIVASRPPARWSGVAVGMKLEDLYARLGEPYSDDTFRKPSGPLVWQRDLVVGRWELYVTEQHNGIVRSVDSRWSWSRYTHLVVGVVCMLTLLFILTWFCWRIFYKDRHEPVA
jgi:hypothetical protein